MDNLRLTLVQADLRWEDSLANLGHFENLLKRIEWPTDLIILPEMFSTGFSMNSQRLAESMGGQTIQWMKSKAAHFQSAVMGSVIIKEGESYFNRLIFMQPDGNFSTYDKKHLFSLATEDEHYKAGTKRLIEYVKDWKICPLICYDLRFPEWARNREEYDVLVFVANWPKPRRNHWKTLLAARAVENQCYVAAVNRVGKDGNNLDYSGDSGVYDFNGQIVEEKSEEEAVFSLVLKKEPLIEFRKKLPFLKDQETGFVSIN